MHRNVRYICLLGLLLVTSPTIFGQFGYGQDHPGHFHIDTAIQQTELFLSSSAVGTDSTLLLDATCSLAKLYLVKTQYTQAQLLLENLLRYPFVTQNPTNLARTLIELGNVSRYKNEYPIALNYYFKANTIISSIKKWDLMLRLKIELAECYRKIGSLDKAREYIIEAFQIQKQYNITNASLLIKLNNRAAAIENESGTSENSILFSLEALRLAKKNNELYSVATSLNELGYSYKHLPMLDSAIECYKAAEKIWLDMGAYREAIHAMNNRAMLYAHNTYPRKLVFDTYENIIQLVESKKIDYPLRNAFLYLSIEYAAIGDYKNAYGYLNKFHDSEMERLATQYNTSIVQITEEYENQKIKAELQKTNKRLDESESDLKLRNRENFRIYISLAVLGIMLLLIAILLLKLKQTNNKLKRRNKEKDVFIQEIHHRVKNNLQFVSSLINMQMTASLDSTEIVSLNEASRRIRAMALVHEMLYKQEESIGVSIKQYLEELIYSLNDLINSESRHIQFKTNIINKDLSITASVALGMITSELISNSIKYAFVNVKQPMIEIVLEEGKEKDQLHFIVRDNGNGFIRNENDPQKLGMRLIDIFSRQLKGTYDLYNEHGCVYELYFKLA